MQVDACQVCAMKVMANDPAVDYCVVSSPTEARKLVHFDCMPAFLKVAPPKPAMPAAPAPVGPSYAKMTPEQMAAYNAAHPEQLNWEIDPKTGNKTKPVS